jgi:hypothetical protein
VTDILNMTKAIPLSGLQLGGMSVEFTMLALAAVLGFVHLFLASHFVTQERGVA